MPETQAKSPSPAHEIFVRNWLPGLLIIALIVWPILPGLRTFTYIPVSSFEPDGALISLFPGADVSNQRMQVSIETSPLSMDPVEPINTSTDADSNNTLTTFKRGLVEVEFLLEFTSAYPILAFTGPYAESVRDCTSEGETLIHSQTTLDQIGQSHGSFAFDGLLAVEALPHNSSYVGIPNGVERDNARQKLEQTPITVVPVTRSSPTQDTEVSYTAEKGYPATSSDGKRIWITCTFETSAFWEESPGTRTFTFPSSFIFAESQLARTTFDPEEMVGFSRLGSFAEIYRGADWDFDSASIDSTFVPESGDRMRRGNANWNDRSDNASARGFSVSYSDRIYQARSESRVFFAGIGGGLAASLLGSLVLAELNLWRNRRNDSSLI